MTDFTGADALMLLGAVPVASLCVNAGGIIVFANDAVTAISGAGSALARTPVSRLLPEWHAVSNGSAKSFRRETLLLRSDGSVIPVELSVVRFSDALTGVVIRDLIDERAMESMRLELERQNDEALLEARAAHRRLGFFIDMLPQAACVFDAQDRYILWNEKYAALYPEIADHLRPGMPFREILEISLASGDMPEMVTDPESWIEERMKRHRLPVSQEEQMLRDGRWLRHDDRRTPDGGAIGMRIDITDLKRREESFRLLFDANPMPMMVCDAVTLDILAVNSAAVRLYGFPAEAMRQKCVTDFHGGGEGGRLGTMLRGLEGDCEARTVWHQKAADGTEHHVLIYVRIINEGPSRRLLLTIADVSDRIRAEAHATHLAHHDPLTGLPNRMQFRQKLESALETAARDGQELAVHYLDLDGFKPVNDTFGHAAGDMLLKQVAERLKSVLLNGDLVARLGGDEFAILQHASAAKVADIADRCILVLGKPFGIADRQIGISVSIGIAVAPENGFDPDELMSAADTALYQAKASGKSTWRRSRTVA
ncbi:diguanylate cyclase domain-containing protein [Rhizobium sp. PL01]|uniref:diguanylate cyclase domain-containing protein n=1 Tax=Rhizobium sp. PL01 TaxID=3085631 RepID=UPI0029812983|nr:diguanylate cyclase [Rhizobium sp. PL01]MDW5314326.1 diguanylate cyclase [Rhizobium sp. PL01]